MELLYFIVFVLKSLNLACQGFDEIAIIINKYLATLLQFIWSWWLEYNWVCLCSHLASLASIEFGYFGLFDGGRLLVNGWEVFWSGRVDQSYFFQFLLFFWRAVDKLNNLLLLSSFCLYFSIHCALSRHSCRSLRLSRSTSCLRIDGYTNLYLLMFLLYLWIFQSLLYFQFFFFTQVRYVQFGQTFIHCFLHFFLFDFQYQFGFFTFVVKFFSYFFNDIFQFLPFCFKQLILFLYCLQLFTHLIDNIFFQTQCRLLLMDGLCEIFDFFLHWIDRMVIFVYL